MSSGGLRGVLGSFDFLLVDGALFASNRHGIPSRTDSVRGPLALLILSLDVLFPLGAPVLFMAERASLGTLGRGLTVGLLIALPLAWSIGFTSHSSSSSLESPISSRRSFPDLIERDA